jgi:hypothetical protein
LLEFREIGGTFRLTRAVTTVNHWDNLLARMDGTMEDVVFVA